MKLISFFAVWIYISIICLNSVMGQTNNQTVKADQGIKWLTDIDEAKKKAKKKKILLNFTGSDWCSYCKRLEREVFLDKTFVEYAEKNFICVKIDTTSTMLNTGINPNDKIIKKYNVSGFPTIIFLNSDGAEIFRTGYIRGGSAAFIKNIDHVNKGISIEEKNPDTPKSPFDFNQKKILETVEKIVNGDKEKTIEKAVMFSKWTEVKNYLAKMEEKERKATFNQILQSLHSLAMEDYQKYLISTDDLFTFAECSEKLNDDQIKKMGEILKTLSSRPGLAPHLPIVFKQSSHFGNENKAVRDDTYNLLNIAGMKKEALEYLPGIEEVKATKNLAVASVYLQQMLAKTKYTGKNEDISVSMDMIMWVLMNSKENETQQEIAFRQIDEFLFILPTELGYKWLVKFFKENKKLGFKYFIETGKLVSNNSSKINPQTPRMLLLQKLVVDAWLNNYKEDEIKETLNSFALNWMKAAQYHISPKKPTAPNTNPRLIRSGRPQTRRRPNFGLSPKGLLLSSPSGEWLKFIKKDLRGEIYMAEGRLNILAENPEGVLNVLEAMAKEFPVGAENIANEFIQNWSKVAGYKRILDAGEPISSQIREKFTTELLKKNIQIKTLLKKNVNPQHIVRAFSSLHGETHIYTKNDIDNLIKSVENPINDMISTLALDMRNKLNTTWRKPPEFNNDEEEEVINQATLDMYEDVNNGYEVIDQILNDTIKKYPEDWRLRMALGRIRLDSAAFYMEQHEEGKLDDKEMAKAILGYIRKRGEAFEVMREGVKVYSKQVVNMPKAQYDPSIFVNLFNGITEINETAALMYRENSKNKAIDALSRSLIALPEEARGIHMKLLADQINSKISKKEIDPKNLYSYMCDAERLLGENSGIEAIRKKLKGYKSLLDEIKLRIEIDGTTDVVHDEQFGVFVIIESTKEVAQQTQSFLKYIQNPEHVKKLKYDIEKSLRKSFNVKSIAFYGKKTESYNIDRKGWVATPIAYILLATKDAAEDKVSAIQFEFDPRKPTSRSSRYNSHYRRDQGPPPILLPLTSNAIQIKTGSKEFRSRPFRNVKVTQTLDTRKSAENKIFLEVVARGRGVVSKLDEVLDMNIPGYKVTRVNDRGTVIAKIDSHRLPLSVISEHLWLVELTFDPNNRSDANFFNFPKAKNDDIAVEHKQYVDADVLFVEPVVPMTWLPFDYRKAIKYLLGGVLLFVSLLCIVRIAKNLIFRKRKVSRYTMPAQVTPFAVFTLISLINEDSSINLNSKQSSKIEEDMTLIEKSFFLPDSEKISEDNLREIASFWIKTV